MTPIRTHESARAFDHEAYFYSDVASFVDGIGLFVREGLERDDAVIVVVDQVKCHALTDWLGTAADSVTLVDVTALGPNPARIIPRWQDRLGKALASGRSVTGVSEPAWASGSPDDLVEGLRHETLLNLAFDEGPGWSLLCPYDTAALPPSVLDEAARNHRVVTAGGVRTDSVHFLPPTRAHGQLDDHLVPPPPEADQVPFTSEDYAFVRRRVAERAAACGLTQDRTDDLVLAVHELATNTVHHGDGRGQLSLWTQDKVLVVEIRGTGEFADPLLGRVLPGHVSEGGRGLWLVNQLCDLVQLRNAADGGTVVRVHTRVP